MIVRQLKQHRAPYKSILKLFRLHFLSFSVFFLAILLILNFFYIHLKNDKLFKFLYKYIPTIFKHVGISVAQY